MNFMENTGKAKVILVDKEEVSKTLIESYINKLEFVDEIQKFSELNQALLAVDNACLNIFVIDVSDDEKDILKLVNNLSFENNNFKFILVSYNLNTNFIVEALRSGAKEFLAKPIIKDEIIGVLDKVVSDFYSTKSIHDKSKIISTFSNKGGLGKTTVAVNLAKEIADLTKEKVVLVDLNMHLGDVTAFLDLNPVNDIKYAVDNLERADDEFFFAALEQYKTSNFYVLADSPFREPNDEISVKSLISLLKKLRETFSYVIIDNNSTIDSKLTAIFEESDLILFITAANLPTLRNCQRCLELFDKFGYKEDKLKLVLNRYISNEDYKVEDVEAVLNRNIFWKIPNNYFAVIEAINKGITVKELNEASNISENYRQLAQEIINRV